MDKINLKKYNVIILAAGIGKRIGPKGKKNPKSLFKINNKAIIDNLFEILIKKKPKNITIIVGYKSKLIKKYLKKYNDIKINYVTIDDYSRNGHSYSWYSYKKIWKLFKRPTILFHADILFDKKYLDNLIKSKYKDIIGIRQVSKKLENEIFYVSKKKLYVEKIAKIPNIQQPVGEIIGINKISYSLMKKIFSFMEVYFKKKLNKKLSWEIVINDFIQKNPNTFKILNHQRYPWININRIEDFNKAKKLFD